MLYIKNESSDNNELIVNNIIIRQIINHEEEVMHFEFLSLGTSNLIYKSLFFNIRLNYDSIEFKYNGLLTNLIHLINTRIFDLAEISNIELRILINELQLFYMVLKERNILSYHDLRRFEVTPSHVIVCNNRKDFIIINDINEIKNESFNVEIYKDSFHYNFNISFKKDMKVPLILNYLNSVKNYNFITVRDNLLKGYDNNENKSTLKNQVKTFYSELLYQLS